MKTKAGGEWLALLTILNGKEREYVEYLPWEKNLSNAYHRIDKRIRGVLNKLEGSGHLPGVFYFATKTE